jgi:NRAMP (natural resistance-associated macrophage protein)-like metal ion transporter
MPAPTLPPRQAHRAMIGPPAPGRPASFLRRLGPGLITGAADDDPSGIATYSQAGAQFGVSLLWTPLFTLPLMVAVQSICARIGRVTGQGLTRNLERVMPRPLVACLVAGLIVANTINIAADLGAMGSAASLVLGGPAGVYTLAFGALSTALIILVPYHRYAGVLKWLTLSLMAYVAVAFTVRIDWAGVALATLIPRMPAGSWTVIVAVLGTTISPYLFFWQASEEVEEEEVRAEGPLLEHPEAATEELRRIDTDTAAGMVASNVIAFFVILTAAATLHAGGLTEIRTAEEAARALRPIAGPFSAALFCLGLVGVGLLAVPVLAGSAAYAVAELFGWRRGLERPVHAAPQFYAVILAVTAAGYGLALLGFNPMRALFWSAVINGVVAPPLMASVLLVARRRDLMGRFRVGGWLATGGWAATAAMTLAVAAMLLAA